jgi:hypothetical protein
MKTSLTFWLVLVICSPLLAQQAHYVSNSGSNSQAGSAPQPWQTLAYAATQLSPGDTIVLRGGTYAGNVTIATDDITVMSYPGEWAVVEAPINDSNQGWALWFNAEGAKVYDLELLGGYYYCLKLEAGHAIVKGCKLHDSGRDCIKIVPDADNILIEQNEIYNSGQRDNSNAEGIDNVNADQMVVRGNFIHDIATNGVYAKGGARDCLIENNLIMDCGGGILLGYFTDLQFFDPVQNPNYHGNLDGVVRNNFVIRTEGPGIGMFAALRPVVVNNTLVEVAESSRGGVHFEPVANAGQLRYVVDPMVVNNIVTLSATSSRTVIEDRNGGMTGTIDLDYNRYYDADGNLTIRYGGGQISFSQWQNSVPGGDAFSLVSDPQLGSHYRLQLNSSAIDMGRTLPAHPFDYDYEPRTGVYDIGAEEVGGSCPELMIPPTAGTIGTGEVCSGGALPIEGELEKTEAQKTKWKIYPNPVRSELTLEVAGENWIGELRNGWGQRLALPVEQIAGNQYILATSSLPSGVYWLGIREENGRFQWRSFLKE